MPQELNPDQKAGLEARNAQLRAYAQAEKLESFLTEAILGDHSISLGSAKARLRGLAQAKKEAKK